MAELDDWRFRGRCYARHDLVEVFFDETPDSVAEAKALCVECPVIRECREHASRNVELHGVWGGESGQERRARLGPRVVAAQDLPG